METSFLNSIALDNLIKQKNVGISSALLTFQLQSARLGLYRSSPLPAHYCFYSSWCGEISADLSLQVCAIYNTQQHWNRWQISPSLLYKKAFLNFGLSDAYGPGFNEATYGRLAFTGMGCAP
jgi:hypothetical protein